MASSTIESPYTPEQIKIWLRGLLTIAWADGHFDEEEKSLITAMTHEEFAPNLSFFDALEPVSPEEIGQVLGTQPEAAEDFLRMAVMVALADGVYSTEEDQKLQGFCSALNLEDQILEAFRATVYDRNAGVSDGELSEDHPIEPLKPAREWLDQLDVKDPRLARFICKLVPAQCPFERDVTLFKRKIVHIPAMCKLNPLYDQLVGLRFRALSYLADDCGEDVTPYI
ncbi:Mo-dependent nitrogenase C-terminal domain-containing protein [Oscillatoria sp. CS-180]|uniref:Mo-dependent nitrogenase C-terminal domain-containing protein n=1 Tax=Oscillatoria sp. CS-180 TaxID=3021720 RepID=UPI00232B25E9|nr:Mo-dependent nitrogenase C-terminal domain-containing protein [Oscillatoria sp. CS-180]MDB9526796.1 Mo-dependent nitrogenase C-terminal domain-containing protein [Oscillatoria sp. CS-180]